MADFFLDVRIDPEASYKNIKGDILELEKKINDNPPKIKLGIEFDKSATAQLSSELSAVYNAKTGKSAAAINTLTVGSVEYHNALKRVQTLLNQVRDAQNKWTAAKVGSSKDAYSNLGVYESELEKLHSELLTGQIDIDKYRRDISRLSDGFTTSSGAIKAAGENTRTWTQRVGSLAEKFGTWFSITQVITEAVKTIKKMVAAIIELDTAMTELKKVTNETDQTYERVLSDAVTRAKELGASLSDVVSATADFARLGFDVMDAEKLADVAITYKNVGDGIEDINEASESIIATMQAFSVEASDAMSIVDKFNEVGNNYAITSAGVGDALLRSAAAMEAANNTLDETIALTAAANTVVQDPDKVGTTLKTVSMFLRAAKTEAEEAGESTDGMANSVSELRKEILSLTGNKVDIQLNENEFKSTYQILKELSSVWGELTDISQANILELTGGKRNSNVVAALLENFSVAEKALATSLDSAGSATKENEKYLNSIQGKLDIMKASFEELSQNFIDGEMVKGIVDAGTGLLNILNIFAKIINVGDGVILKIAAVTAAFYGLAKVGASLGGVTGIITKSFNGLSKFGHLINDKLLTAIGTMGVSFGKGEGVIKSFTSGIHKAFGGVGLLTIKIAALTAILYAAYKAWDYFTVTAEEAAEAVNKAAEELDNNANELKQVEERFEEVTNRIVELNSIERRSLTEQAELEALQQESAELQAQIQLLKEKNEILNADKKEAESQAWETANKVGIGNAYNQYGKMSNAQYLMGLYTTSGDDNGMSAVSAANLAMEERAKHMAEIAELQTKINNSTATEEERARYERLNGAVSGLETGLAEILDVFSNCGEEGRAMSYKISLSLMTPLEQLQSLKAILDSIFKDKSYTAEDIFSKYGKEGNETLTTYIDALVELGTINPLSDGIEGLSAADLSPLVEDIEDIEKAAEKASDKVTKLSDKIAALDKMSSIGKSMQDILSAISDDDGVSYENITSLVSALEEAGIASDNYVNSLLEAGDNSDKIKTVFADITNEMIANAIATGGLVEENEKLLALQLKSIGVANAEAIAHDALAVDKTGVAVAEAKLAAATEDNISTVYEEIGAMMSEQGATQATKQALFELALQKLRVNENKIVTSSDIEQLIALANTAGATAASLENLSKAKAHYAEAERLEAKAEGLNGRGKAEALRQANSEKQLAKQLTNKEVEYNKIDPNEFIITPTATPTKTSKSDSAGGLGGKDAILDAWNKLVNEKKHLVEMDKMTQEEYYDWLASAYKSHLKDTEKYADEIMPIEEELYNWEKEKIQAHIDDEMALLDNKKAKGEISEEEYFSKVKELYDEGYEELQKAVEENGLYGEDNAERLQAETEFLEEVKQAHNDAFNAERQALEHKLAMNLITEEQYLIELQRLYDKYYAGNEMYSDEAMEIEEELYDKKVELVEKWAEAATQAIEEMTEAMEQSIEAIQQLIQDSIDTHEENFDLEKSLLDHALAMNYISEEEYYDSLEGLYKSYFKDKNTYTEQYWENQEEIYQHEQAMLEDSASAIEDVHAKVVEMIKQELEDAVSAIEETKEKYLDLIEIRREALSDLKDEEDYEKERAEQLSTISELQRQLNALAYDTSSAGVAKYKEVYAELQEAQKALEDMENERAYEVMNDQLDDEEKSIEVKYDTQISEYEDLANNNEYLVEEAWARLSDKNSNLYNELMEYNKKYSTSIKDDITGSWEAATKALEDYTSAKAGYESINGQIGESGMSDAEYREFQKITQGKQIYNWASIALEFGSSMLEVGASLLSGMMSIVGGLIGGPAGTMLSLGGGMIGTFAGLGSSVLKVLGNFATGTNHVPKTGWYRTNELGDEINLVKDSSGNEYRLLTEGSHVIDAESTSRLMNIIKNPSLLADWSRGGALTGKTGSIGSIIDSSVKEVTVAPVFQIHSSNPEGVASEIRKMFPEIAKHTAKILVSGAGNMGTKQKVQHLY